MARRPSAEDELRDAGLFYAAAAYGQAWTVGGILCLGWGLAVPALFFWRRWSVAGAFGLAAVVVTGTALLVLAAFLRRRRVWAAHGLWAIALAGLLSIAVFTFAWGGLPPLGALVGCGIAAVSVAQLGGNAWLAVGELERAAHGGERGFGPLAPGNSVILPAMPADPPASDDTPPAAQPPPPSNSSREK